MSEASDRPATKAPGLALLIASGFGLGYIPKAPGTAGSLGGVAIALKIADLASESLPLGDIPLELYLQLVPHLYHVYLGAAVLVVSVVGVWCSGAVARHLGEKDPQFVVIDEISGQMIAYLGCNGINFAAGGWKYLLAGLILFRVFDIWKPFPARQAEKLPGGWGIMADDWVAGLYAALGLWLARTLGL